MRRTEDKQGHVKDGAGQERAKVASRAVGDEMQWPRQSHLPSFFSERRRERPQEWRVSKDPRPARQIVLGAYLSLVDTWTT